MNRIFSEMLENGLSIDFKYDSATTDIVSTITTVVDGKVYKSKSLVPLVKVDSPSDIASYIDEIMNRSFTPQIKENCDAKTI